MVLHLKYAAFTGAHHVVFYSPDTDVTVLLVHHFSQVNLKEALFKVGRNPVHRDLTRYISMHVVVKQMTQE